MNANLKLLLENIVGMNGNNDLMIETTEAAKKLLEGGYNGHSEDIENLDDRDITTGFELEKILSQGSWYFQVNENLKCVYCGYVLTPEDSDMMWQEFCPMCEKERAKDLCPDCNVYCGKRFINGRCE